jgi:hypothetical protein
MAAAGADCHLQKPAKSPTCATNGPVLIPPSTFVEEEEPVGASRHAEDY